MFRETLYGPAFHLLMAVLHLAEEISDEALVKRVEQLAAEQAAELERGDPEHLLARGGARLRGTQPLFESAELHAQAVRLLNRGQPCG